MTVDKKEKVKCLWTKKKKTQDYTLSTFFPMYLMHLLD